jgi:hypothetical protein
MTDVNAADLYLDLMKRILTNFIYMDQNAAPAYSIEFNAGLRANGMD